MSERELWGKAFSVMPGDVARLRHPFKLVPIDVQTTRELRGNLGIDEAGYQAMLRRCREANPGCGEPLLVRAEDGAAGSGGVSLCGPRTLDVEALERAGIDAGPASVVVAYRDRCEERDLELLASNGDYYPYLTRVTPVREALDDLVELAQENLEALWRDDLLTPEEHEAALRQLKRERDRVASLAPEGATLESLAREARAYEAFGQYAAVVITPEMVWDILRHKNGLDPDSVGLTDEDLDEIARCSCENFPPLGFLNDLVVDQIVAEARNLLESRDGLDRERRGQNPPLCEPARVSSQPNEPSPWEPEVAER